MTNWYVAILFVLAPSDSSVFPLVPLLQLSITAFTVTGTAKLIKRGTKAKPAVTMGQALKLSVPLPNVVQLDTDLVYDFALNVVQNLKIEHDARTGINVLVVNS